MEAIILAGGFGTRLREVVPDLPKPMAPVAGRPFLEVLLGTLASKGFTRVVLSLGYLAGKIVEHFGEQFAGMDLVYEIEEVPLGTGGAIRRAIGRCIADHVFVFNGDTYLDVEATEIEAQWLARRVPIIVAREVSDTARYGRLSTANGRVTGFREKGSSDSGLINAGCYVLPKTIFDEFPHGTAFSLETDFLATAVMQQRFDVFVTTGQFIDIGIPEDFVRAQTALACLQKMSLRPALFLDRDGVINVDHGYVWRQEQFEFVDGIFELCRNAKEFGYFIFVVTNQAGIGRGYYSEQDFEKLTDWMCGVFRRQGAAIDRVYYCPFHPVHGIGQYKADSPFRKPRPGMILKAASDFNINLERSVMVGDKESDIHAGLAAGVGHNLLYDVENTAGPRELTDGRISLIKKLNEGIRALQPATRPY